MTKYTPGPWRTSGTQSFYVFAGDEVVTNGSTQANARLIAAAPDLLAVAQEAERLMAHMVEHDALPPDTCPADLYDMAYTAIAKATGGAP